MGSFENFVQGQDEESTQSEGTLVKYWTIDPNLVQAPSLPFLFLGRALDVLWTLSNTLLFPEFQMNE